MQVQIIWRWKAEYVPKGAPIRWLFVAHGAAYDRGDADEMAALIRSQGKMVKFLPIPTGRAF